MKAITFVLLALLTAGCAGHALRRSYAEYSEVYGQSANSQLLLNLARISQDEPPYYIQLGKITSSYKFSASAELAPSDARKTATEPEKTVTWAGKLGGGMEDDPSFEFVPLNGAEFAKSLNTVIPAELFYTFYDQGFHADDLARITVASVQFGETTYMNQPMNPTYPGFLAICASLRKAQLNQTLRYDEQANVSGKPARVLEVMHRPDPPSVPESPLILPEFESANAITALEKGFSVTNEKSNPSDPRPRGYVLKSPAKKEKGLFQFTEGVPVTKDIEEIESFWVSIPAIKLKLRTYTAAFYAVTKEEQYFQQLLKDQDERKGPSPYAGADEENRKFRLSYHKIPHDGVEVILTGALDHPLSFRPILSLTEFRDAPRKNYWELVRVKLHDLDYVVGDAKDPVDYRSFKSPTSNRKVFTLLSYLFTEISIDPQKLPVQQQLVQIR